MKLWDVLAICVSLSAVSAGAPIRALPPAKPQHVLDSGEPVAEGSMSRPNRLHQENLEESFHGQHTAVLSYRREVEDVMGFIQTTLTRLRRASEKDASSWARAQRGKRRGESHRDKKGRHRGERRSGRRSTGRGCVLKQVHLNVTDLGLGYRTKEELIFRYCSGPCIDSETNYDKILNNLTHNKKLSHENPARTCCRPIAFDDDLSFLDDDLVYHTLKKHSARKCGCV